MLRRCVLSTMPAITLLGLVAIACCSSRVRAEDWPQWRGMRRDGIVQESSGFRDGRWLGDQPRWTVQVGEGAASPIVVGESLFCLGWRDGQDQLLCLNVADGAIRWKQAYPGPRYARHATGDEGLYSGPSSTPHWDAETNCLFTLSTDGELQCWNTAENGRRVWRLNLYDDFHAPRRPRVGRSGQRDYGYTSSPLVHGNSLIVEVGAPSGNLAAFDKRSGKLLWQSQTKDAAGHNSGPTPIVVEGVPCVAVQTFEGLLVARLDPGREGQTVATYPWKTEFANNIASVAVRGSDLLLTSAYNQHRIVRLHISLKGATPVWESDLASGVCTPVIHAGHVYFASQQVYCLDYATGQKRWSGGKTGDAGSCFVTSDDRLVLWTGRGNLSLIETAKRSPGEYRVLTFKSNLGRSDAWPHVVLANGSLYCKDRTGHLICFATD